MFRRNDDEEDDDLEERVSFLGNDAPKSRQVGSLEIDKSNHGHRSWRRFDTKLVAIAFILSTSIFFFAFGRLGRWDYSNTRGENDVVFSCPATGNEGSVNESGEAFEELYAVVSRNITNDKDEFLKTFRTKKYDGWNKPYNTMKEGLTPFKNKFFRPYLKPGMKIYESACGIGLNLLMTLEILQEPQKNATNKDPITGITVYGNEYVKESVERSKLVLGEGVIPAGNQRGVICTGDSTNLSHVPSDAFDLVYSGYITPLLDPLHIDPEDEWVKYDEMCKSLKNERENDWMGQALWDMVVKRQNDWYGRWVREMSRIAKPGVPVIAESISQSYCSNRHDWGGVDIEFWRTAAEENSYGWNVDPNSIQIISDPLHSGKRYHVFMLKNKD